MVNIVKIYFERNKEQEIRRLTVTSDVVNNLDQLLEKIRNVFLFPENESLQIRWKDPENDLILMSSNDELAQALANAEDGLLRLYVCIKVTKSESTNIPKEGGKVHPFVLCDGCDQKIVGSRYKCLQCQNFDLCASCDGADKHSGHDMIKLVKPTSIPREWLFAGARKFWKGMFNNCPSSFTNFNDKKVEISSQQMFENTNEDNAGPNCSMEQMLKQSRQAFENSNIIPRDNTASSHSVVQVLKPASCLPGYGNPGLMLKDNTVACCSTDHGLKMQAPYGQAFPNSSFQTRDNVVPSYPTVHGLKAQAPFPQTYENSGFGIANNTVTSYSTDNLLKGQVACQQFFRNSNFTVRDNAAPSYSAVHGLKAQVPHQQAFPNSGLVIRDNIVPSYSRGHAIKVPVTVRRVVSNSNYSGNNPINAIGTSAAQVPKQKSYPTDHALKGPGPCLQIYNPVPGYSNDHALKAQASQQHVFPNSDFIMRDNLHNSTGTSATQLPNNKSFPPECVPKGPIAPFSPDIMITDYSTKFADNASSTSTQQLKENSLPTPAKCTSQGYSLNSFPNMKLMVEVAQVFGAAAGKENGSTTANAPVQADVEPYVEKPSTSASNQASEVIPVKPVDATANVDSDVSSSNADATEDNDEITIDKDYETSPNSVEPPAKCDDTALLFNDLFTKGLDAKTTEEVVAYPNLMEVQAEAKTNQGDLIQTIDPLMVSAVATMQSMGFTNEGGWLERLLISKKGNINEALDALYPSLH